MAPTTRTAASAAESNDEQNERISAMSAPRQGGLKRPPPALPPFRPQKIENWLHNVDMAFRMCRFDDDGAKAAAVTHAVLADDRYADIFEDEATETYADIKNCFNAFSKSLRLGDMRSSPTLHIVATRSPPYMSSG